MAPKPRINLRFRDDLWTAINRRAKRLATSATAELEAAAERYLIAEGEIANGKPEVANGNRRASRPRAKPELEVKTDVAYARPGSAAVKAGVAPRPKRATKR